MKVIMSGQDRVGAALNAIENTLTIKALMVVVSHDADARSDGCNFWWREERYYYNFPVDVLRLPVQQNFIQNLAEAKTIALAFCPDIAIVSGDVAQQALFFSLKCKWIYMEKRIGAVEIVV